jgi:cytidine deaminase
MKQTQMEQKQVDLSYSQGSLQQLEEEQAVLANRARAAAKKAYAPYSKFKVGAALELDNGELIVGNNQENASYPVGLCAERVALFYAHSNFPNARINRIAIYAPVSGSRIIPSPCGSCRQAIAEFRNLQEKPIEVLVMNDKEDVWVFKDILDLLPFDFNAMHLIK